VTRPEGETVAAAGFMEDQEAVVVTSSVSPVVYRAVALSWSVCPGVTEVAVLDTDTLSTVRDGSELPHRVTPARQVIKAIAERARRDIGISLLSYALN